MFDKSILSEKLKSDGIVILKNYYDGNYIHRGDIIKSGKRYTLTNYYFPFEERTVVNNIKNKFKKLLFN